MNANNAIRPVRSALPLLAATLYFISMQFALLIATVNPLHAPRQRYIFVFVMFFQLVLAALLARQRRTGDENGLRRFFIPALALAIPCIVAAHTAFAFGLWTTFSILPALFGCLFLPLIWTAFAVAMPQEHQGMGLAVAITMGEFVWVALLPLLSNPYVDNVYDLNQLAHLHKIQALVQVTMCGILIYLLRRCPYFFLSVKQPEEIRETQNKAKRSVLPALLLMGVVFFLFSGFTLDTVFPKITHSLGQWWGDLSYFLLIAFPVSGLLLDISCQRAAVPRAWLARILGGRSLHLVAAFLALSMLSVAAGLMLQVEGEDMFLAFYLGRQIIMLLLWFILFRLAGRHPFFPLLAALVQLLDSAAYPGKWLSALTPPEGRGLVALALAGYFTALAAYLCGRLKGDTLSASVLEETAPQKEPDTVLEEAAQKESLTPGEGRNKFFAEHGVTDREMEVAELIIQGLSTRSMAQRLFLSENTIKTHVRNLLSKSGFPNRKAFLAFFIKS
jgi:DNA-binding CsgD family transcriptional regulator